MDGRRETGGRRRWEKRREKSEKRREQGHDEEHQFLGGKVEKCNLVPRPGDIFPTLLIDFYRGRSPSFFNQDRERARAPCTEGGVISS